MPSRVKLLAIQSRPLRLHLRAAIECCPNGYVEPTRLSFAVSEVIVSGEEDITLYPMLGSGVQVESSSCRTWYEGAGIAPWGSITPQSLEQLST